MATHTIEATFPTKGQLNLPLTNGAITKITCTKRGLYRLVAVGGDGGYAQHYSDHEGTSVFPGISARGGQGGTVEIYRVIEKGTVFFYVGGGTGGLTSSIGGDYPYGKDGEAGFNGGHSGKYRGNVTSGASGGMSYFQFNGFPFTADEIRNAKSYPILNTLAGIAGGGGGGKGILGGKSDSHSSYWSGTGGAGGGNPNGLGHRAGRIDSGQEYQDAQSYTFSWDTFGVSQQLHSWGGFGGAGYICGTDDDNFGGNGGMGWINPLFASVTAKGKTWYSTQKQGHTEAPGIYWLKNWVSPLIYYGDREVDSLYYGDREVDTVCYGDREIGS